MRFSDCSVSALTVLVSTATSGATDTGAGASTSIVLAGSERSVLDNFKRRPASDLAPVQRLLPRRVPHEAGGGGLNKKSSEIAAP